MQKNLVIVESPAKAKTIEKFLGKDYKVMSSYGHIRDLKKREISIDEKTLEPEYNTDGTPLMVTDKDGNYVQAQKVVTDPGTALNYFGATHTYSGSMSMSTRLYGMFNFGKHGFG